MAQSVAQVEHLPGIAVRALSAEMNDQNTADCAMFCHCDDGSDYAVKTISPNRLLPHVEWFCTRLGEIVGLASPPCRIIELPGGEAFGSRWESGHLPDNWWIRTLSGEIDLARIAPALTRIFTYDLFIGNVDRHLGNYIVRQQRSGVSLLAFDYSRAWLSHGFPVLQSPLPTSCHTLQMHRFLTSSFGPFLQAADVDHVISSLLRTTSDRVQKYYCRAPHFMVDCRRKGSDYILVVV